MKEKLVSIAVPVYNVEKYLEECLNSIINQTYKNIEIILVNDGSTDSSLEICKQFLHDDRIIIIDKKNEGLSVARQIAIDKAQGEYLCMIDSDDYIESDYIELLYTKISNEACNIVLCGSRFFSDSDSKKFMFRKSECKSRKLDAYDIEKNLASLLSYYYMSDSWAKIYNLDFIRQSNTRFSLSKDYNGTDLLFNHLLVLSLPKISLIPNVLYCHRIHASSRVHRKNKKMQEGFEFIMSEIIKKSKEYNFSESVNNQFSIIYMKFMRMAAQDIINSEKNINNIRKRFMAFHISNKNYLMKENKIRFSPTVHERVTNKFFSLLLKYNSIIFLYIYLKIRQFRIYLP